MFRIKFFIKIDFFDKLKIKNENIYQKFECNLVILTKFQFPGPN